MRRIEKEKILFGSIVIGLLVFVIITFSIYGYGASIHGDEYFSIGFANNTEGFLFLSQGAIERYGTDGWITGEFLHDWLSVQQGEQFSIMKIHRNVRDDVHPPLYFMLLNAISSLFVDQVTLIPGYFVNVCSGIVICIFLYLISRKIFNNKWLACVPALFWAASNAASIAMTYIRMYAPLCALCLICLYIHLEFLEKEKPEKYIYVLLGVCTTIGTLTHYYFYVWMFVVFWITVAVTLYHSNIKKLLLYGISLLVGEGISLAAYPYVFEHLLFSERGTQVQQNLANSDLNYYIDFFKQFMNTINRYVYTNRFHIVFYVFIFLIFVAIVVIYTRKKGEQRVKDNKASVFENGYFNFLVVAIATLGYFIILFKISYSANWIYISPIFAPLTILTIGVFAIILNKINPKYCTYILFGFCAFCMIKGNISSMQRSILEHEKTKADHEKIVEYSENCDVLFFYNEWNNLYDNQILELMEFDQIRAIPVEEIEKTDYEAVLSTRADDNNLVFYIPVEEDGYQEKINEVAEKISAKNVTLISEEDHAVYYVELND